MDVKMARSYKQILEVTVVKLAHVRSCDFHLTEHLHVGGQLVGLQPLPNLYTQPR